MAICSLHAEIFGLSDCLRGDHLSPVMPNWDKQLAHLHFKSAKFIFSLVRPRHSPGAGCVASRHYRRTNDTLGKIAHSL
jgi:hypothetical protein